MSNAPAGWYPQDDGRQRYWDGQQWTDHFAPVSHGVRQPLAAPSSGGPDRRGPHRPWFKKKRVIVPAGLLAGFIAIGTLADPESDASMEATAGQASVTASRAPESPTPSKTLTVAEKAKAEADAKAKAEAEAKARAKAEAEAKAKAAAEAKAKPRRRPPEPLRRTTTSTEPSRRLARAAEVTPRLPFRRALRPGLCR